MSGIIISATLLSIFISNGYHKFNDTYTEHCEHNLFIGMNYMHTRTCNEKEEENFKLIFVELKLHLVYIMPMEKNRNGSIWPWHQERSSNFSDWHSHAIDVKIILSIRFFLFSFRFQQTEIFITYEFQLVLNKRIFFLVFASRSHTRWISKHFEFNFNRVYEKWMNKNTAWATEKSTNVEKFCWHNNGKCDGRFATEKKCDIWWLFFVFCFSILTFPYANCTSHNITKPTSKCNCKCACGSWTGHFISKTRRKRIVKQVN